MKFVAGSSRLVLNQRNTHMMRASLFLIVLTLGIPISECALGAGSVALPALVTRATDSLSALLTSRSANSQQHLPTIQNQPQSIAPTATGPPSTAQGSISTGEAQPAAIAAPPAATSTGANVQQQQQPQRPTLLQPLQAQLNAIQTQAQRQISQLNGLVLNGASQLVNSPLAAHAANLTGNPQYGNVLEVLSNVGKAIQQQIGAAQQIQIVSSPSQNELASGSHHHHQQLANNKKNEYQSVVEPASNVTHQLPISVNQYREQGEQLRQEIVKRAGQLQQVVASSMEVLKNNGDLIVRRLLEQLNNRLDQAKSKADKIINEPATNEVAIKALHTINLGLNNLNNIITNIVNRLDIANKDLQANQNNNAAGNLAQRAGPSLLFDAHKFKLNFHQIGQQFSSALNAAAQQQQRIQQQVASQMTPTSNTQQLPQQPLVSQAAGN